MDDLGPLPTLHPRHVPCAVAGNELSLFLLDWQRKHELTATEFQLILAEAMRSNLQFLVQIERRRKDSEES